jgi:transcription antitermination factor NusG
LLLLASNRFDLRQVAQNQQHTWGQPHRHDTRHAQQGTRIHWSKSLKSRCDATGKIVPNTDFAPGDRVEIVHGPLSEFVGTVEKIDPQQRVWILLEIMGQTSRVRLDRDHLSKD